MMLDTATRSPALRRHGLTMVIDPGLPTAAFADLVDSHGWLVDLVKFGWGTALVTRDLARKTAILREHGVGYYFGGTMFERYVWDGRLDEFVQLATRHAVSYVEVSNGTIPMDPGTKAEYVRLLAQRFPVISEVGSKDAGRAATLGAEQWVQEILADQAAGAVLVTTEARESGRAGVARPDGTLRTDVLDAILAVVESDRLLFEAPTKELQVELIRRVGPLVNLGNIAPHDVVGLETLRLGLRGDTLLDVAAPRPAGAQRPRPVGAARPASAA